jgi:hypothetical protein
MAVNEWNVVICEGNVAVGKQTVEVGDRMKQVFHYFFKPFFVFPGGKKFSPVTTDLPVLDSNSLWAFFATAPPLLLALAFSVKPSACSLSAICRVESFANAVN